MIDVSSYVQLGFSPCMLYPASFTDPTALAAAIKKSCRFDGYETFETFLPRDAALRKECISEMKAAGKILHYNAPADLQVDGPYYSLSTNPAIRAEALAFAKMQVDFAAEAGAPILVFTASEDKGDSVRPELMRYFEEYFLQVCEYAEQYQIQIMLEPIERHRFKKLLLGPTAECAAFIAKMRENGAQNANLMMDTAHLPLMEESMEDALCESKRVGLSHLHVGDAVLNPSSHFYGHTHPPLCVRQGEFSLEALTEQMLLLFRFGYMSDTACAENRARVSLEVKPYPGVSEETSIRMMYEILTTAISSAAERYRCSRG